MGSDGVHWVCTCSIHFSIASMMAGKVTAGAIDASIQDSLVEETLKEIGENTWLN